MKSISLYVDNGTWLCRVHPFTKLMYILTAIAVPLISGSLAVFPAFMLLSLFILFSGKVLKRAVPLIAFSFTILVTIFLIHGLFNQANESVLFSIGPISFYREGLYYALKISFNILNMLLSFAILVLTTKPSDLVDEMEKKGFSPRFCYIINSVFQIIPQMMGMMNTITDAQRSRGMETEGSLRVRAKAFIPLVSPVVTGSLINTRERAIALEVRAFGNKGKKTYLFDRPVHKGDKAMNLVLLAVLFSSIIWRIASWLI